MNTTSSFIVVLLSLVAPMICLLASAPAAGWDSPQRPPIPAGGSTTTPPQWTQHHHHMLLLFITVVTGDRDATGTDARVSPVLENQDSSRALRIWDMESWGTDWDEHHDYFERGFQDRIQETNNETKKIKRSLKITTDFVTIDQKAVQDLTVG